MNVFKFLSATLLAGTCLFSGCKKEKSIVPENPSVVEITVSNSEGEVLENETVRMYDETSYESFKKNHSTKPLLEITTDSNGVARFYSGKQSLVSEYKIQRIYVRCSESL